MKLNPIVLVVATALAVAGGAYAFNQNKPPSDDEPVPSQMTVELSLIGKDGSTIHTVRADYAPANPLKAMTIGLPTLSVETPNKNIGGGVTRIDGKAVGKWTASGLQTDIETYALATVTEIGGSTPGGFGGTIIHDWGKVTVPKTGGTSTHTFEGLAAFAGSGPTSQYCGKTMKSYFTLSGRATGIDGQQKTAADDAYATVKITCPTGGTISVSLTAHPFTAVYDDGTGPRSYPVEPVNIGFT